MYKKNNGSTEQEILQNQFSAYVKKAVHNRRIQFLTEKSRKFRFETPLFDLDYLLFDTTDIIQEITDHETVRQALRSIKENERRMHLDSEADKALCEGHIPFSAGTLQAFLPPFFSPAA